MKVYGTAVLGTKLSMSNGKAAEQTFGLTSLVDLYAALGGGWEYQEDLPLISENSREEMGRRVNWGDLLDEAAAADKSGSDTQHQ